MTRYRWQDAPLKMRACDGKADPAPKPEGSVAALKSMNSANREFWDGHKEDAEVTPSAPGTPAALAAINERNRRFWEKHT